MIVNAARPGSCFEKEKSMDGRPYVYVDSDGNRYRRGRGLSYATD